jgi:hypothetical protein
MYLFRVAKRVTKINEFMDAIGVKGGMSLTTGYNIEFDFNTGKRTTSDPPVFVNEYYGNPYGNKNVVNMLCDEAQLPNVVSTTGTVTGRYLGEGMINYPHTRTYTDLGLGFMCDAEQTPLKFLTSWYDYIFGETPDERYEYDGGMEQAQTIYPRDTNRTNRLNYINDYVCNLRIMKTEPNKDSSSGRVPITYVLENCYPYSIDAVPLAYGSSQLTRVTASFYYTRHTVLYGVKDQKVKVVNGSTSTGPVPIEVIPFQN